MNGMHVTHWGRPAGESYVYKKLYDPLGDREFLLRRYDEGGTTAAERPGFDQTNVSFGSEYGVEMRVIA